MIKDVYYRLKMLVRKYILKERYCECRVPNGSKCWFNLNGECFRYSYENQCLEEDFIE